MNDAQMMVWNDIENALDDMVVGDAHEWKSIVYEALVEQGFLPWSDNGPMDKDMSSDQVACFERMGKFLSHAGVDEDDPSDDQWDRFQRVQALEELRRFFGLPPRGDKERDELVSFVLSLPQPDHTVRWPDDADPVLRGRYKDVEDTPEAKAMVRPVRRHFVLDREDAQTLVRAIVTIEASRRRDEPANCGEILEQYIRAVALIVANERADENGEP